MPFCWFCHEVAQIDIQYARIKGSTRHLWIKYHNDPKFSDRQVYANSVDPDQKNQSDKALHCLLFRLFHLKALLYAPMVKPPFSNCTANCSGVRVFRFFNMELGYKSLVMRKPVFGVCDQGRLKPACTAAETR